MDQSLSDIYLVKGNINVFCGAPTEEFKKDILYSSLFGELVTSSKLTDSPQLSWSNYVDTVSKIGWATKSRELKRYEFATEQLFDLVKQSTGLLLTKEEQQTIHNACLVLKETCAQSPTLSKNILDKFHANTFVAIEDERSLASAKQAVTTSIRMTIVCLNANIVTLQVAFKTNDGIRIELLDQPILDSIKDGKSNMWLLVSSLDAHQYDNFRTAVIKKIGHRINTDLLHVPTPAPED
jgi:hypothetical protein